MPLVDSSNHYWRRIKPSWPRGRSEPSQARTLIFTKCVKKTDNAESRNSTEPSLTITNIAGHDETALRNDCVEGLYRFLFESPYVSNNTTTLSILPSYLNAISLS